MSREKSPEAIRNRNVRQNAWQSEHTIRLGLKLNTNTDKDIIEQLEQQESKQGYIRRLIREDMARAAAQAPGAREGEGEE